MQASRDSQSILEASMEPKSDISRLLKQVVKLHLADLRPFCAVALRNDGGTVLWSLDSKAQRFTPPR